MNRFDKVNYASFNDFFTRELSQKELIKTSRAFDLISPCDSKLSVYKISSDLKVNVKNKTTIISSFVSNVRFCTHAIFSVAVINWL